MALIDIEYGSLASSETMNKNFLYLDDKISDTSESIMTSISSILSNIATINTRLNEVADIVSDSIQTMNSTIEDYKAKTKLLVNKASMVPNWADAISVTLTAAKPYVAPSNGYILLIAVNSSSGNLIVNGKTVVLKTLANAYDYASQLITIPVLNADSISTTASFSYAYFVPAADVGIEEF